MTYFQLIVASKYLSTCHQCLGGEGGGVVYVVSAFPFTTELQVKPGRTGLWLDG